MPERRGMDQSGRICSSGSNSLRSRRLQLLRRKLLNLSTISSSSVDNKPGGSQEVHRHRRDGRLPLRAERRQKRVRREQHRRSKSQSRTQRLGKLFRRSRPEVESVQFFDETRKKLSSQFGVFYSTKTVNFFCVVSCHSADRF